MIIWGALIGTAIGLVKMLLSEYPAWASLPYILGQMSVDILTWTILGTFAGWTLKVWKRRNEQPTPRK